MKQMIMSKSVKRRLEVQKEFDEYSCPFCKADLRSEPIPEELKKMYSKGSTHYSRLIGIEIPDLYDGVSFYECPDCGVRWDRFTGEKVDKKTIDKIK